MTQNLKNGTAKQVLAPITRVVRAAHPRANEITPNIGSNRTRVGNRKTLAL